MNLSLTPTEHNLLLDILKNYLSDFRMEISQTDTPDYRTELKAQEVILDGIIANLEAAK